MTVCKQDAEMAALNKLAEGDVETDEKRELLASVGAFVNTWLKKGAETFPQALPKEIGQGRESKQRLMHRLACQSSQ